MPDTLTPMERAAIENWDGEVTVYPRGACSQFDRPFGMGKERAVRVIMPGESEYGLLPEGRDERVQMLDRAGAPLWEICALAGCSQEWLRDHRDRLGLKRRGGPRAVAVKERDQVETEFRRLWQLGVPVADIAGRFGRSPGWAQRMRQRLQLQQRNASRKRS